MQQPDDFKSSNQEIFVQNHLMGEVRLSRRARLLYRPQRPVRNEGQSSRLSGDRLLRHHLCCRLRPCRATS